jgi:hypothetical protein
LLCTTWLVMVMDIVPLDHIVGYGCFAPHSWSECGAEGDTPYSFTASHNVFEVIKMESRRQ